MPSRASPIVLHTDTKADSCPIAIFLTKLGVPPAVFVDERFAQGRSNSL